MKRFITHTEFRPIRLVLGSKLEEIKDKKGKTIIFKQRKAVENYCLKNECMYVERKHIFFK